MTHKDAGQAGSGEHTLTLAQQEVWDAADASADEIGGERDDHTEGFYQGARWAEKRLNSHASLSAENATLREQMEAMREALYSINRYGLDTMSGPMEVPPDLAVWYRDGVKEMVHRARAALSPDRKGP